MNTVGTASTCFCDNFGLACESGWVSVPNCAVDRVPCGAAEHAIAICDRIEGGSDGSSGTGGIGGAGGTGNDGGPPPCTGMSCGVDRGIACGTCGPAQFCADDHTCKAACVGMICGDDHGVPCGSCPADRVCSDQQQACLLRICPPNQISCDINYRATCNAIGSGFSTRLENCGGTSGLVCYQGSCGTHAVEYVARDVQGSETIAVTRMRIGNFYEVTANRKLTELTARSSAFQGDLNWVVLELGSTPIQLLNLRATWNPDAEMFSSSGAISVSLAAGKTYFIGVDDDSTYQFDAYFELRDTQNVTFGRAIGGVASYLAPTAPTTSGKLFTQRLTTDAP